MSSFNGDDTWDMGAKRPRAADPNYPYYGSPPATNFMYSSPYSCPSQPPPFPVIRLRGLPFDCTEADIAEFLYGLSIVDILFVNKGGRFCGEAFCVLGYHAHVDFALRKDRQHMGRRYVEVFRSKRLDYYKAIANEVAIIRGSSPRRSSRAKSYDEEKENATHTGILRLRGLPYSVEKEDIMKFFGDFNLEESSIHITINAKGKPTGEAFVEFSSPEESKAAMCKDRMTIGVRYVELFPSSTEEMQQEVSENESL